MKNKLKFCKFLLVIYFCFLSFSVASEIFNFDVTEIEITENGNRFIGSKGGVAKNLDGTSIKAKNFDYNKKFEKTQDLVPAKNFVPSLMGWNVESFKQKFNKEG